MAESRRPLLACIDFSKESFIALKQAYLIKKALGAPIHVLHVEDTTPKIPPFAKPLKIARQVYLEDIRRRYIKPFQKYLIPIEPKKIKILFGSPHEKILEEAKKFYPQMIFLGSHGFSDIKRLLIGSVSETVVQLSPYPVWVQRGTQIKIPKKIHIAFDLSRFSESGVKFGLALAKTVGAVPTILYVSEPKYPPAKSFQSQKIYDEEIRKEERTHLKKLEDKYKKVYPKLKTRLIKGNPAKVLIRSGSRHATDLLIITTHGRTGLKLSILGSAARHVLRHITVPLVAIPPK